MFIFFLICSSKLFAQRLDLKSDSVAVIDGVYIRESSCDHDTLVKLYENSLFVVSDSNSFNHEFQKGEKKYFEVIIKTKNCRCRDCSWTKRIIIECTNLKEKDPFLFNSYNSTLISWGSWSYRPKIESEITGLLIKDENNYSIKIDKYFSKQHPKFILETIELKDLQIKQ